MATTTAQYSIMPKRLRPRKGVLRQGQEDTESDDNQQRLSTSNIGSREQSIQDSDMELRRRRREHRQRHRHRQDRHLRSSRSSTMERDHPEGESEDYVHVGRPMPARYEENDSILTESSPHVAASISASASVSVSHAEVTAMTEASSVTVPETASTDTNFSAISINKTNTSTAPDTPASRALVVVPPRSPPGSPTGRKPPLSPTSPITPPPPPRVTLPLPPGMVNLGNTCYMNASVHMLMSLPHFVADLCAHEAALRRALQYHDAQNNLKQSSSLPPTTTPSARRASEPRDTSLPDDATTNSSASKKSSSSSRSNSRRRRRSGLSINLLQQPDNDGSRDESPSTSSSSQQEEHQHKPTNNSEQAAKTPSETPSDPPSTTPSPVLLQSLAELAVKLGKVPPTCHTKSIPTIPTNTTLASTPSSTSTSNSTSASASRPQRKKTSVNPYTVKTSMDQLAPHFRGFHQQDAHEFVSSLIDHLHEEITKCRDYQRGGEDDKEQANQKDASDEGKDEKEGDEEEEEERSFHVNSSEERDETGESIEVVPSLKEEPTKNDSFQDVDNKNNKEETKLSETKEEDSDLAQDSLLREKFLNVPRNQGDLDSVEAIRAAASSGGLQRLPSAKDVTTTTMYLPQHFPPSMTHGARRTVVHDDVDEVVLQSFGTTSGTVGGPCGVFSVIYDYMDCVSVGVRGGEQSAPAVEVVDGHSLQIQQQQQEGGGGDDNFSIEASAGGGSTCPSLSGEEKGNLVKGSRIMDWARNSIGSKRDVGVEVVVASGTSEDENDGGDEAPGGEEEGEIDANGKKTSLSTGYVRVSSRRRAWGGSLTKQDRNGEAGRKALRKSRSRRRSRRRNAQGNLDSALFVDDDADDTTSTTEADVITATTSEDDSSSNSDDGKAGSSCENNQSQSEQSDGGKKEQLFGPNHHSRCKNEPKVEMPLPSPPPPPPLPTDHFCMEVKVKLVCTSPSCSYTRTRREMYRHISIDVGPTTSSSFGAGIVNKVGSSSKKAAAAVGSAPSKDSQDQASTGSVPPPKRHRWSVEDGIRAFFAPKVLELKCEKCETCETATQYIEIVTLPRALLVHLKRFVVHISSSSSNGMQVSVKKDSSRVGHKEKIDLSHYCSSTEEGGMLLVGDDHLNDDVVDDVDVEAEGGETQEKNDETSDDDDADKTRGFVFPIGCANYRLRSVVHHIGGSASSGHYIADALVSPTPPARRRSMAQSPTTPEGTAVDLTSPDFQDSPKEAPDELSEAPPSWLRFNDEIVSSISRKEVMGKDSQGSAYMIMYELDCPGGMEVEADVVSAYNKKHGGMWHLPKWMVKRLRRMHLTRR